MAETKMRGEGPSDASAAVPVRMETTEDYADVEIDDSIAEKRLSVELPSPQSFEDEPEVSSAQGLLEKFEISEERDRNVSTIHMLLLTVVNFGIQGIWSILMSQGTIYLNTLGFTPTLTAVVWIAGPLAGTFFQPLVGAHSDRCRSRFGRRTPYIVGGTIGTVICVFGLASVQEVVDFFCHGDRSSHSRTAVKLLAVFWVYALNMLIQPLQVGARALITESCPPRQQAEASGWAGRFNILGSLFTFLLGSLRLPKWLGNTEFMAMSFTVSAVLIIVTALCLIPTNNRTALKPEISEKQRSSSSTVKDLVSHTRNMSPMVWSVCKIQLFAWLGWFPFLYYNTAYIGSLSKVPTMSHSSMSMGSAIPPQSHTDSGHFSIAARTGSFASFLFAAVALISILILPLFTRGLRSTSLPLLWTSSHIVFSGAMFSTMFAHTISTSTALVAIVGESWAVTQWVPYAIIGQEIASPGPSRATDDAWDDSTDEYRRASKPAAVGATLGLHNAFIAAPQILAALSCAVLFRLFETLEISDSFGWVLRCAGVPGLVAAWMSWELE